MGGCISILNEQRQQAALQQQLNNDFRRSANQETKLLLLGAGNCGKTTVLKQMKLVYMNGFSQAEIEACKLTIYRNVIEAMRLLLHMVDEHEVTFNNGACIKHAYQLKSQLLQKSSQSIMQSNGVVDVVRQYRHALQDLWEDEAIQQIVPYMAEYESAPYFYNQLDKLLEDGYTPTTQDMLNSRVKSTGISETRFKMDRLHLCVYDVGGQRSERKKWIHCFAMVTSLLFVTSLSEYDQMLAEDSHMNRTAESLILFEAIINSPFFKNTSVILFLNKVDLLQQKIDRVPLIDYFPEYAGGSNLTKATKYFAWRYKQCVKEDNKIDIYTHTTCATDTEQLKVVFTAVKDILVRVSLEGSGFM